MQKVLVPESTARVAEVMGGKHLVNEGVFFTGNSAINYRCRRIKTNKKTT